MFENTPELNQNTSTTGEKKSFLGKLFGKKFENVSESIKAITSASVLNEERENYEKARIDATETGQSQHVKIDGQEYKVDDPGRTGIQTKSV